MKNKLLKISIITLILIFIILFIVSIQQRILNNKDFSSLQREAIDNFSIESKEQDNVLITVERKNGIDQIEKPNGSKIYCNNKKIVAFDYKVEKDNNYTFKITDSDGNQVEETIYAPGLHIELTKNKLEVVLDDLRGNLKKKLWNNRVATNYMTIGIGEETYIDTQTTDMATVFNTWSSFGDGVWKYDSTNKYVYNTKNTDYFTGYYAPKNDYNDIELEFEARTTDSDDDIIGAMIRFNRSGTNYNSYLFLLDRHDTSGKGVSNGAYNGLTRVANKNLAGLGHNTVSNLTKLSVNSSLRWTRNTWQKYKLVTKGTTLQAYIDDKLVATATDNNIPNGSYGFVCLSQAMTYFRAIRISTTKENTFEDIITSVEWDASEKNVVIKFNNEAETTLNSENIINKFINNNIHYIGVGSETNKTEIETFIQNIDNKGIFTEGITDTDIALENAAIYISNLIK